MTTHLDTPPAKGVRCRISSTLLLALVPFLLFFLVGLGLLASGTAAVTHGDIDY